MRKPDVTFVIRVCPMSVLSPCAARIAKEREGFFGFHDSNRCANCHIVPGGFELWGENGHCQGRAATRPLLAHMLRNRALKQWRTQDGRLMGYIFRKGGQVTYLA